MAAPIIPARQAGDIHQERIYSKILTLSVVIVQTTIRIFFVFTSILIAAASIPTTLHVIAIPVIGFGATTLAGLFFRKVPSYSSLSRVQLAPLLHPPAPHRHQLPADAPPGIKNQNQNCAFNSIIHLIQSEPAIGAWLRNYLRPEMDLRAFEQFLTPYQLPEDSIQQFRNYIEEQVHPRPSIPKMFKDFIHDRAELRLFKDLYENLYKTQDNFANFVAGYDQAIRDHQPVNTSQQIRLALSQITALINPSPRVQVDAAEVLQYILDLLPPAQKIRIEQVDQYEIGFLPPILDNPDARVTKDEHHTYITLSLTNPDQNVAELLGSYCNDQTTVERRSVDGVSRSYPTTITRRFLEAPQALRFQIKRFDHERLPKSLLTRYLPYLFPDLGFRQIKKSDPVGVPPEIEITLVNQETRRYRLSSYVVHHGASVHSGHYTAGRIIGENRYILNDDRVILASQQSWESQLRRSYILCYLPVN